MNRCLRLVHSIAFAAFTIVSPGLAYAQERACLLQNRAAYRNMAASRGLAEFAPVLRTPIQEPVIAGESWEDFILKHDGSYQYDVRGRLTATVKYVGANRGPPVTALSEFNPAVPRWVIIQRDGVRWVIPEYLFLTRISPMLQAKAGESLQTVSINTGVPEISSPTGFSHSEMLTIQFPNLTPIRTPLSSGALLLSGARMLTDSALRGKIASEILSENEVAIAEKIIGSRTEAIVLKRNSLPSGEVRVLLPRGVSNPKGKESYSEYWNIVRERLSFRGGDLVQAFPTIESAVVGSGLETEPILVHSSRVQSPGKPLAPSRHERIRLHLIR